MIDEEQDILGYISHSTVEAMKTEDRFLINITISSEESPSRVPCYHRKPEHPYNVMNNMFECLVSINCIFDEKNK